MNLSDQRLGFRERGGVWVVWQVFFLLLAYIVPVWTGVPLAAPSHPAQFAGLALLVAGGLLALAAFVTLGESLTPYPRPRERATLRTLGVYALVRHPIYAGLLIASFGWTLYRLSIPGLVTALALGLFFDRKASREEAWLAEKYPDYPRYRQRVKKLIPWIY